VVINENAIFRMQRVNLMPLFCSPIFSTPVYAVVEEAFSFKSNQFYGYILVQVIYRVNIAIYGTVCQLSLSAIL